MSAEGDSSALRAIDDTLHGAVERPLTAQV
jgi:hypothetical protein